MIVCSKETKLTWPEADPSKSDIDSTLIVGPDGGVHRTKDGDSPCSLGELEAAREMLALGPLSLLPNAKDRSRFESCMCTVAKGLAFLRAGRFVPIDVDDVS
jgi:hypothetical protein